MPAGFLIIPHSLHRNVKDGVVGDARPRRVIPRATHGMVQRHRVSRRTTHSVLERHVIEDDMRFDLTHEDLKNERKWD